VRQGGRAGGPTPSHRFPKIITRRRRDFLREKTKKNQKIKARGHNGRCLAAWTDTHARALFHVRALIVEQRTRPPTENRAKEPSVQKFLWGSPSLWAPPRAQHDGRPHQKKRDSSLPIVDILDPPGKVVATPAVPHIGQRASATATGTIK